MSNEGGRHAVVTGSSSGIGMAIAQSLLAGGWRVSGFDVAPPRIEHAAFRAVAVDLCDGAATEAAAQAASPVQALVHAAGVLRVGPLGALDADAGSLMWRLHVDALTRIADIVVPSMVRAGRGRVVMVGSRVSRLSLIHI